MGLSLVKVYFCTFVNFLKIMPNPSTETAKSSKMALFFYSKFPGKMSFVTGTVLTV